MNDQSKKPFLCSCKSCGQKVSIMAKLCPQCGIKNPSITWKQSLLVWGIAFLSIYGAFHYKASKEEPSKSTEISQQKVNAENSSVKAEQLPATLEELKAAYETSTGRASIIRTLRVLTEPMIAVPNQTQITQDLLDAKNACTNLSRDSYLEKTPNTDREIADLYLTINHSLSNASQAICDRINAAIELSSGTQKPAKMVDKFEYARQWYVSEWANYETAAETLANKLAERQAAAP